MVIGWPFLEAWVTGDKREHHLLQRPRNAPTRTAFLAAMVTVYGLLWAAGGNDILATQLPLSLNSITYFMRAAIFVVPPIVFYVTRRWCIGLQRADNDRLLHGYETGIIMRSPDGAYTERHLPISEEKRLHAHRAPPRPSPRARVGRRRERRGRAAAPAPSGSGPSCREAMFADNVQKPTVEELEEARHHAEHVHELEAGLDHPAAGHEFDDHPSATPTTSPSAPTDRRVGANRHAGTPSRRKEATSVRRVVT